ncbi:MAG: hypothetical protein LBS54_05420 [Dysgonamonadaceae bacterium]|jgi:hypothetical protein|nr:hypothetical protein [Dysgonamonadaceae bacterium]
MKNIVFLTTLALCLVSCNHKEKAEWTSEINDYKALSAQFAEPSNKFGTAPLWVWNTRVTPELIDMSLKDYKDKGFGGVFVHPRPGMITEYLSDDWFTLYEHAIKRGKELGLDVWIYDENSYPSGFAGGHVPAEMPESTNLGQSLVLQKFTTFPDTIPADLFIVLKRDGDKVLDVTASLSEEAGKTGEYYAFTKGFYRKSPWYGGYSYIDLLLPGVTEKFIEITMSGYKQRFGAEFGKTVPGWFTDEPNISPPAGGVRWTPDLFDVFAARWKYDLKENLPSLFEETGDWKRIRHNYQQTLLDLFIERWAKPCYEYCEQNNLKFTGHYWEHGWPDMSEGPDNMAMYAWHQQPAIDMLFNQYNDAHPMAQFGNIRSVKELRSVANQLGRNRTLSETYGGGGWDETFRDFKRLGDWEYALGVNFMNQHIADLSIAGARKYDYPPVFSQVEPWWEYYRSLNVYFARLSMALSAGEQVNDILLIEPTTSIWLYYAYRNSNRHYFKIGETFQKFETAIEKAQVEYDLASEDIMKTHGNVKDNRFVVGRRTYSQVIIPPMTENFNKTTFTLLKNFTDAGGRIISYAKPEYIDGQKNDEVVAFFSDTSKVEYIDQYEEIDTRRFTSFGKITFTPETGNDLYHQRREMKDGQILFLANSSLTEIAKGTLQTAGKDALELHALTGEVFDYPETCNDGKIELAYEIPPAGSLLLYVFNTKQSGYMQPEKVDYAEVVQETSSEIRPVEENVLTVDFCDLTLGGETFFDQHLFDAADRAFKAHGFSTGNPWNTSIQYKNSTVSRDTFTSGGFKAAYHFTVAGDFDYSGIKAVVERSHLYTVEINNTEVKAETGATWLDPEMDIIPVGQYVRKGKNTITLTLAPFRIMAEIEQVFILGDFRVTPARKGFEIAAPAETFTAESWKLQGYPFYSQTFSYIKTFNIREPGLRYAVELGEWEGTVAEIRVNGKSAGIVAFEPYRLEVGNLLREGDNTIEVRIAGSNQNLLGPFHTLRSKGLVSPSDFRRVKEYPAGNKYLQNEYGLTGGFKLRKQK